MIIKTAIDDDYDEQYDEHEDIMSYLIKSYINYYNIKIFDKNTQKEKEKGDTMKKYDYKKAVMDNICNNIIPHIEIDKYKEKITDISELKAYVESVTHFNDKLEGDVICYAYDEYEAEEYLHHNLDLLKEAAIRLGINPKDLLNKGAIFYDWMIREYIIHYAIEDIFKDKTLDEAITLIYNIKKERFRKEE